MPDIDPSIPLGVKVPDPTQSLSGLLSLANSAQGLQQNQQKSQQGAIDLQERQGIQGVLADPKNYTGEDGTVDFNKALPAIMKVAPTTGMKYVQNLAEAQRAHTDATQALNNLTSDNRAHIGSVLASLPQDATPELVGKTIDALKKQYKGIEPAANVFMSGYKASLNNGGPQGAYTFIQQQARSVLPQETQQTMNTPSITQVDNGAEVAGYNLKPGVQGYPQGGQVFSMPKQLGPGQVEAVQPDSQNNLHVVTRTPDGKVTGTRPLQAAPTAPGATTNPGPFTLPPGETSDTLKAVQGIRANANQAARTVPDQQFNANQIIKLAGETNTGKGAELVQGLRGGYAGLPWTNDAASNYNQLGHYMALQTSQLAQASGLGGTDAAHGIAAEQAGNKAWTEDAIKSTARVNRALSTGVDLFNRGVENAIESTASPFAARQFQNQWSKTASVEALRVYDSYKNRTDDPEGWSHVVKELGGPKSEKFQKTMKEVDAMRALVRGQ